MPQFGTFTDSFDGHVYRTVLMPDGKWWFAENYAWAGAGVDYDNNPANRAIYGRLYTQAEMNASIPAGCHAPTYAEFVVLQNWANPSTFNTRNLGNALAATTIWPTPGLDSLGFALLPGGVWQSGAYQLLGTFGSLHGTNCYLYSDGRSGSPTAGIGIPGDIVSRFSVRYIVDSGNVPGDIPDTAPTPSIYPPQGTYQGVQLVVLKSSQSLPIRYTLDGSEPTISSPLYVGPIPVYQDTQIKAAAFYGNMPSDTVTASYTITNGILKRIPSYRDRVLPYLLEQYKGDNT